MSAIYQDEAPVQQAPRTYLRDLPLAARLTLAAFLISVGLGYTAALIQLKVQHARPGDSMPAAEQVVAIYHGQTGRPQSKLELLLEADEGLPFNGSGQMRTAFTTDSTDLDEAILDKADFEADNKEKMAEAEKVVRQLRDGERVALIEWLRAGASKEAYEKDSFVLPAEMADRKVTEEFVEEKDGQRICKVRTLFTKRCVRCHKPDAGSDAKAYPLDTYAKIKPYTVAERAGGMSIKKLAQTTHVHLLGFSMLYGITGLIFALSSYPGFLRVLIAPLALVAQVVDVSFWWLARLDAPHGPMFAKGIMVTGGIVALSLGLQILLSLFNLFGKVGKLVLVLGIAALVAGGLLYVQPEVVRYLDSEKATMTLSSDAHK